MSLSNGLKDLRSEFKPLNRCMYCGKVSDLRREHIVPYGLGGPGTVPRGSCGKCAIITSRFERDVLRGPFWGLRAYLRLSTRRPASQPKHLPLIVVRGGKEHEESVPVVEHPIMLSFPLFAVPSLLTGKHIQGISIRGVATFNFGKSLVDVKRSLGADDLRFTESSRPVSFARMLAKIAWATAIAHGHGDDLDPGLCNAILHTPDDIGRWVGTYTDPLEATPGLLHEIRLRQDHEKQMLIADVKLFANSRTPRYGVILGRLS